MGAIISNESIVFHPGENWNHIYRKSHIFLTEFQLELFLQCLCHSVYIRSGTLHDRPAAATSESLFIATIIDHEQAFIVCRAIYHASARGAQAFHI